MPSGEYCPYNSYHFQCASHQCFSHVSWPIFPSQDTRGLGSLWELHRVPQSHWILYSPSHQPNPLSNHYHPRKAAGQRFGAPPHPRGGTTHWVPPLGAHIFTGIGGSCRGHCSWTSLAIKLALEEWWHWLEGAQYPFEVITDHKNLQSLREAKRLNTRQARWALFFTRFNFIITYRPGNKNIKADALSRLHQSDLTPDEPEPILPSSVFLSPIQWALDDQIRAATLTEPAPPGGPKARSMSHLPFASPFWTQSTPLRDPGTQAATEPSRSSKAATGGPTWPGMSAGMSKVVRSVPSPPRLVYCPKVNWFLYQYLAGPGLTWE